MWLQEATKQHEGVCPITSIIKEQNTKARSPGMKCMSSPVISSDGFYSAKVDQKWISGLHVVMKKYLQFSREFWAAKVNTSDEINWLILSCGFCRGNKKLQRLEQAHFLVSRLHRSISHSRLCRARLCSNVSLLAGYFAALSGSLTALSRGENQEERIIKKNLWDQGIDCFACCMCHCSA